MYPGVELRLMRYAVVLSEELNFSRAAKRLHVSQPSLSKQIQDLERYLQRKLFDRTKREVRLTAAGEAFVKEARQCLLHNQRAIHMVLAVQRPATFALGYSPFVNLAMIGRVRAIPVADLAGLRIDFVSTFTAAQLQQISAGDMEAGLVVLPVVSHELIVERLCSEPLRAVLPAGHRLARARRLRLHDLQQAPFISIGRRLHPSAHACLMGTCVEHGFTPLTLQDVTTFTEAASMVADGLGFTIARPWPDRVSYPGVVFKRIEGDPLTIETGIVFGHAARSEVIEKLISVLAPKRGPRALAVPFSKSDSQRMVA